MTLPIIGVSTSAVLQGCDSTPTANELASSSSDITFLTEGAKMEAKAIKSYQAVASLIDDSGILRITSCFLSHHESHLNDMNKLLRSLSQSEIDLTKATADQRIINAANANPNIIDTDIVKLALTLEFEAGLGYFGWVLGNLAINDVKKFFVNTYPVEVSHFLFLKNKLIDLGAINIDSQLNDSIPGNDTAVNSSIFEGLVKGF
jgi:rubrerythrin